MIKLRIVTPETTVTHEVSWIDVTTPAGNYVIQPDHAPMLLVVRDDKPVAFGFNSGKTSNIRVHNATMVVDRKECTILAQRIA
jgi:F0F1-type ATP synthase epsilon subunit